MKRLFSINVIRVMTFIVMAISILLPYTAFGKRIGLISHLLGLFLWLTAILLYFNLTKIIKKRDISGNLTMVTRV